MSRGSRKDDMVNKGFYIGAKTSRGWLIKHVSSECKRPPEGWYCTRGHNHEGPCAAHERTVIGYRVIPVFEDEVSEVLIPPDLFDNVTGG